MIIKVETFEQNRFVEEVYVYSLSYDCNACRFIMMADGYDMLADRDYRPKRIHAQWDNVFVAFEDRDEANDFTRWLKEANSRAEDSFTNGLG